MWKKLGSPKLLPSTIILRAYDGHHSQLEGLYQQNVPIELAWKIVLIDVEVVYARPVDYNLFLGHSYMYAMKAISSLVFRMMMFPHNKKVITID